MTIVSVSYGFVVERMLFTTENLILLLIYFVLNDNFNCLDLEKMAFVLRFLVYLFSMLIVLEEFVFFSISLF